MKEEIAPNEQVESPGSRGNLKKPLVVALKVAFSAAMLMYVFRRVAGRDGASELLARLSDLRVEWWLLAVVMQLLAIGCAVIRWRALLGGQGIHAPWRFLAGSFLIGRFWGAFTPGGLGLDGWRLYDIGTRTGKYARATALFGVEKILGQLAFGLVVLAGSLWGLELIGVTGLLLVNGFFLILVALGLTLLSRPQMIRMVAGLLPQGVRVRVQTLVDAVCAYHGKSRLLVHAVLLGMGVHAFNNLIYVCAAQALGISLHPLVVFFGSSLQIMSTLLPVSINGIGLREATAVALYSSPAVGLSLSEAVLIPVVGIAAEYVVSAVGVVPFILRRGGYRAGIVVDDEDRERDAEAVVRETAVEPWLKPLIGLLGDWRTAVPPEKRPRLIRATTLGLGAGLVGGMLVGLGEGLTVAISGGGRIGYGVLTYGAVAYGLFAAVGGAFGGLVLAALGRAAKRKAQPEARAYAMMTAAVVAVMAFGLTAFRVRRDVFHEELVWKSLLGLGVLAACAAAAVLLFAAICFGLQWVLNRKPGRLLLSAWGSPAVVSVLVIVLGLLTMSGGQPAAASPDHPEAGSSSEASNILVIVVDTLRADHLGIYSSGERTGPPTPHIDAFAADSIRFDQAFANASWTASELRIDPHRSLPVEPRSDVKE